MLKVYVVESFKGLFVFLCVGITMFAVAAIFGG